MSDGKSSLRRFPVSKKMVTVLGDLSDDDYDILHMFIWRKQQVLLLGTAIGACPSDATGITATDIESYFPPGVDLETECLMAPSEALQDRLDVREDDAEMKANKATEEDLIILSRKTCAYLFSSRFSNGGDDRRVIWLARSLPKNSNSGSGKCSNATRTVKRVDPLKDPINTLRGCFISAEFLPGTQPFLSDEDDKTTGGDDDDEAVLCVVSADSTTKTLEELLSSKYLVNNPTSSSEKMKKRQGRGWKWFWPPHFPVPVHLPTLEEDQEDVPGPLHGLSSLVAFQLDDKFLLQYHCMGGSGGATITALAPTAPAPTRGVVQNIHLQLKGGGAVGAPTAKNSKKGTGSEEKKVAVLEGHYEYWHYKLDGFNDDGWGCAYRSLMTVLSWFKLQGYLPQPHLAEASHTTTTATTTTKVSSEATSSSSSLPSMRRIQTILASCDDTKPITFVGSCDWIGSYEVMMVLQHYMPNVECRMMRLEKGSELETSEEVAEVLLNHFNRGGAPVMIGGSSYAHTIIGISCTTTKKEGDGEASKGQVKNTLLILDPHYSSHSKTDVSTVMKKGWVGWKVPTQFFEPNQWYNLCIPLLYAQQ